MTLRGRPALASAPAWTCRTPPDLTDAVLSRLDADVNRARLAARAPAGRRRRRRAGGVGHRHGRLPGGPRRRVRLPPHRRRGDPREPTRPGHPVGRPATAGRTRRRRSDEARGRGGLPAAAAGRAGGAGDGPPHRRRPRGVHGVRLTTRPVRVDQFDGGLDPMFTKFTSAAGRAPRDRVRRLPAIWVDRPHVVIYTDRDGQTARGDRPPRRQHPDLGGRRHHLPRGRRPHRTRGHRDRRVHCASRHRPPTTHAHAARPAAHPAGRSSCRPPRGRSARASGPARRSSTRAPRCPAAAPPRSTACPPPSAAPAAPAPARSAGAHAAPSTNAGNRPAAHSRAIALVPIDVNNPSPALRRTRSSRASENDATHTRPNAFIRRNVSISGWIARSAFTSMFSNASGSSSSRSSNRLTGSRPPIFAVRTTCHGSRATAPDKSVVRSSTGSWCTTTTPSDVACTSVSR